MSNDFVQRAPFVRRSSFGLKRLATTSARYQGPWPLVGANDSPKSYKWPRPLRLAVAIGFAASVWVAILTPLPM